MAEVMEYASAQLSPCGLYRYALTRRWDEGDPVVWIMLNPSTADAIKDDATIRKCVGFTKRLGAPALMVVNLFAYRATKPNAMKAAPAPIGPENDAWINFAAQIGRHIICAWGPNGRFRNRDQHVLAILREKQAEPRCLSITKDGSPGHPLMLGYDNPLQPFNP